MHSVFMFNRFGVFTKDWSENFREFVSPGSLGWQMTIGGSAFVNYEDMIVDDKDSLTVLLPHDEMKEREDPSTYAPGHWFEFPSGSWVFIILEVEASITLHGLHLSDFPANCCEVILCNHSKMVEKILLGSHMSVVNHHHTAKRASHANRLRSVDCPVFWAT